MSTACCNILTLALSIQQDPVIAAYRRVDKLVQCHSSVLHAPSGKIQVSEPVFPRLRLARARDASASASRAASQVFSSFMHSSNISPSVTSSSNSMKCEKHPQWSLRCTFVPELLLRILMCRHDCACSSVLSSL